MDQLAKLSSSTDCTSARYQDLVLQSWHRDTTLDGVGALRAAIAQVAGESLEAELVERFRAAQKHSCLGQRHGSE